MGHHRKRRGHDEPWYSRSRGGEGWLAYDEAPRRKRLPLGLIVIGLIVWSLLAWGAYLLVDPVLGWFAGSVRPLADAGTGVARWFGLVHVVVEPAILILWVLGSLALLAALLVLSRLGGGRRTSLH